MALQNVLAQKGHTAKEMHNCCQQPFLLLKQIPSLIALHPIEESVTLSVLSLEIL